MTTVRFLVFGDILENKPALERFSTFDFSHYDFVMFDGDILSMQIFKKLREKKVLEGVPKGGDSEKLFKKEVEPEEVIEEYTKILIDLNEIFSRIRKKIKIYGVWGNADHALIIQNAGVEKNIEIIHKKVLDLKGYHFVGYNGRPKYIFETYENPTEHAFDESKAFNELSKILEKLHSNRTILLTHAPPYEILDQIVPEYIKYGIATYGDKAKEGHIGSTAFREITQRFGPLLHVFGHIHESKGITSIGATTFVNTGSFGHDEEIAEVKIAEENVTIDFQKLKTKI